MSPNAIATVPGTLLAVAGRGLLLTGDSGTGKSDIVLGLLDRGHQLIADDAVELFLHHGELHGRCPEALRGLLAIRGLGVLDVAELFGHDRLRASQRIDLEIALIAAPPPADPLMLDWSNRSIMGITIPCLRLPAMGNRDLPLLVETAVKMHAKPGVQATWPGTTAQGPGGKED